MFYFSELAKVCRIKVDPLTYDSPHTKTLLLMQAHFSHLPLPNSDYLTDTKSVLDQAIRVIQVFIKILCIQCASFDIYLLFRQ